MLTEGRAPLASAQLGDWVLVLTPTVIDRPGRLIELVRIGLSLTDRVWD